MKRERMFLKAIALAAGLSPWGWDGSLSNHVNAQADAWIVSNEQSPPGGVWLNTPPGIAPVPPAISLPAPGGALGYNGAAAVYSQHIRTNSLGQIIFFEVDGNVYDGDGYLIADARAVDCTECVEPGVMEFVSVPVPGSCSLYYLLTSVPTKTTEYSYVQVSVLDMASPNPYFEPIPGQACSGRMGNLISYTEEMGAYSQFQDWNTVGFEDGADPTSESVVKLLTTTFGKSISPLLRVVAGQQPNDPAWLFFILSDRVYVFQITNGGIFPVQQPLTGSDDIPTYPPPGSFALDQYFRDADATRMENGQIRLAYVDGFSLYAWPILLGADSHNLLTMRFSSSTGQLVVGSAVGYSIMEAPAGCNGGPTVNIAPGLRGCTLTEDGNGLYLTGEGTIDPVCQTWFPFVKHLNLVNGLQTDLTGLVPNTIAYVRSRTYRNKAPNGNGEAIYFPHATGVAALTITADPTNGVFSADVFAGTKAPLWVPLIDPGDNTYKPRFLDIAVTNDQHLTTNNVEVTCCSYFQAVPGAVVGGYTQGAGQSTWNGTTNPLQPGTNTLVFNCDVIVENGGRLFVSNMTWKFTNGARVLVQPGGYLQLNGCVLTSTSCPGDRWPGVEVHGNWAQNQIGTGVLQAPPNQGMLRTSNTTIENAEVGVLVAKRSAPTGFNVVSTSGGGVVIFTGGIIQNCVRGTDFRRYPQINVFGAPMPAPNRSRFTRTQFLMNQTQGGVFAFRMHARLDNVNGIIFKQCAFKNTITDAYYGTSGSVALGHGIESYQSEFKVLSGCSVIFPMGQECPAASVLPSTFEGLDHAIHALGGPNALRNFTVDRASFTNNICGVYSSGVIGFVAKRNNFTLGNRNVPLTGTFDIPFSLHHRGIYSYTGYGFIVEDNTLVQAGTNLTEGIVIGLSGGHNDMVFRNNATNLERGYIGEGICVDLNERAVKGLHFQCNQNTDNQTNFWSRHVTGGGPTDDQTIRTNQGRSNRPADNTFDQEAGRIDFANDGCPNNQISYWWANPDVPYKPIYVSSDPVTGACVTESNEFNGVLITRPANNCASRLSRVPGPIIGIAELAEAVEAEKLAYADTRYLYQQLIDGGNKDEVLTEIMSSWPQDAWELRQYLLSKSPFLTVEVLQDMVNKPGFPMAMKAEVCIANPDATKKEGFIKWLEYYAIYPMPASMINSIVASWNNKTFRTQLENTLADHHDEMTQAADLWMEELTKDTINDPLDSLRKVWQEVRSPGARYAEAISYMQIGDFATAEAVVEGIPEEHELREGELDERGRMLALIDFMEAVAGDNRGEQELTLAEQDALELQMSTHADRPAVWAQNLLCFHYGRCTPPVTGGESEPKSAREIRTPFLAEEQPMLMVLPNPATAWATFDYTLTATPQEAWVVVMDAQGRTIDRMRVNQAQGQLVWDTRTVAPGLYHIELLNNGQRLQVEKLVVKP